MNKSKKNQYNCKCGITDRSAFSHENKSTCIACVKKREKRNNKIKNKRRLNASKLKAKMTDDDIRNYNDNNPVVRSTPESVDEFLGLV